MLFCRACYGVLRFVMESGAKGCEVGEWCLYAAWTLSCLSSVLWCQLEYQKQAALQPGCRLAHRCSPFMQTSKADGCKEGLSCSLQPGELYGNAYSIHESCAHS